jgi:hypothetical protein
VLVLIHRLFDISAVLLFVSVVDGLDLNFIGVEYVTQTSIATRESSSSIV